MKKIPLEERNFPHSTGSVPVQDLILESEQQMDDRLAEHTFTSDF